VSNFITKLTFKSALIVLASLYLYVYWEHRDNGRYALSCMGSTVVTDTRTGSIFALGETGAATGWVESRPHTGETILHSQPTPKEIRNKYYPPVH
jgi:hypothetical protein